MFEKKKRAIAPQTYKRGMILPVMTSESLVSRRRLRLVLDELRAISALPDEQFDLLYLELICQFAEFVQLIPSQVNGALGGILNEGIARGISAIQHYRSEYGSAELDALNCYALFSAALMVHISRSVVNHRVMLMNEEGQYIGEWRPFSGSMVGLAAGYKLYDLSPAYQRISDSITSILARQVMPESGFLWLSAHWRIFADWLDALNGGGRKGGRIALIISLLQEEDWRLWLDRLPLIDADYLDVDQQDYTDDFLAWLKSGIEDGTIDYNELNSEVHTVEEGVIIGKPLFRQYAELLKIPEDYILMFTQFGNAMGVVQQDGRFDFLFKRWDPDSGGLNKQASRLSALAAKSAQRQGVLVRDAALIFQGKNLPSVSERVKLLSSADQGIPTSKTDRKFDSSRRR